MESNETIFEFIVHGLEVLLVIGIGIAVWMIKRKGRGTSAPVANEESEKNDES